MILVGRGEVFAVVGVDAHVGGERGNGQHDVQRRGKHRRPARNAGSRDSAGEATVTGVRTF